MNVTNLRLRVRAFRRISWQGKSAVLPAAVLSPLYKYLVAKKGINPTVALARKLGGTRAFAGRPTERDIELAAEVVRGVRAAGRVLPTEIVCLPRSLAAWTILRRCGVPAVVIVGVNPTLEAMTAHAWVTVQGVSIGEQAAHLAQIEVFDQPLIGTSPVTPASKAPESKPSASASS